MNRDRRIMVADSKDPPRIRLGLGPALVAWGMGALLGCGGPFANQTARRLAVATESEPVWAALGEGRDDDAERLSAPRTGSAAMDVSLAFADACLAFERGDVLRAISAYLAVLEAARPGATSPASSWAAMAAGRLGTLLEEHPGPDRDRSAVEDRILRLPMSAGLSWEERFAVANLQDRVARRRGDPDLLARVGRAAGCVASFMAPPALGRLPHLDLDRPAAPFASAGASPRVAHASGCRVAVPSFEDRSGAQRMLADVEVHDAGVFDVVVSFRGEARVIVDGGSPRHHGREQAYGPRVSATRVTWAAGRHRLELRLATYGGHPELTVMVVPAVPGAGQSGTANAARPDASVPAALVEAYVANQLGDVARTDAAVAALEALPKLAVGLTLAAALVRDDPSLPAGFARDRTRALLRRALAVDARLARARNSLAGMALEDDRPREALDEGQLAAQAAPRWWLPRLTLQAAYALRGLEWNADRALDEALALGPRACAAIEAALSRAEARRDAGAVRQLSNDEVVCGEVTEDRIARLRRRGDWDEAERLLRLGIALEPDPQGMRRDLARLLLARGRALEASGLLEASLGRTDGEATVVWADAAIAAGERERARARVAELLAERPAEPQLVRAARALGVPLPLDDYRLDGREIIRAFESSKRRYAAPAVVVLDRSVTRVFPSGAEMTLTHEIVRIQSKDAIEKWGEVSLPDGAEILTLRTHKPDGTTREPEEVMGKDAISAADLAIGDYLEKETLEIDPPHEAFAPERAGARWGFLGDRFYFQSFDAPLDRSEYLLVTDQATADALKVDARAGSPVPRREPAPRGRAGAEVVTAFVAKQMPQLFAERSSVPTIEHVPSVRVSMGASWPAWGRFLREQMYGTSRQGSALARAEAEIQSRAGGRTPHELAAALVAWVGKNVEGDDDLRGEATVAVASGKGNRVATIVALAHRLGLSARAVLGRSRFVADGEAPTPIEEADDFAEVLVRFDLPGGEVVHVDPRLKHAPFGYLPPGLVGARVLDLEAGTFEILKPGDLDSREIDLTLRLAADGRADGDVTETLRGWPALEWAEIVDRVGADQTKLRQDFEQRWLGVQFPGATLQSVHVEILGTQDKQPDKQSDKPPCGLAGDDDSRDRPVTATSVRLRYSFASPRFAVAEGDRLRVLPAFFRSQPGRRYANEPQRSTALMTGFEVPTKLVARMSLPDHAWIEGPSSETHVTESPGQYSFLEQRRFQPGAATPAPPQLLLQRGALMSVMRVPVQAYPKFADDLRAAEAYEAEEIVIRLAGAPGGVPR